MPILFALFNALRGSAKIDRITCAALMALALSGWHNITLFLLIWVGFIPAWCLAVVSGTGPRDWNKFKPSYYVLQWLKPRNIYVYGAIGTFVRSFCFWPSIVFIHGFTPLTVVFSVGFTLSYYIGGLMGRLFPKIQDQNVRIGEALSALCLGWVLMS